VGDIIPLTTASLHCSNKAIRADPMPFEPLMTPAEVSHLFGVHSVTVTRWANEGKLTSLRTLGNQRRFKKSEVMGLYEARERWTR
jgi:excisionase family DNA binding protein